MSEELKFKRWFVAAWGEWLVRVEPRLGGDVGVSDLMVVVDERLVPVELKVWKGERISEIRPSQKVWHRQAGEMGLVTLLAVGRSVGRGWEATVWVWGRDGGSVICWADDLRYRVKSMVRDEWERLARK